MGEVSLCCLGLSQFIRTAVRVNLRCTCKYCNLPAHLKRYPNDTLADRVRVSENGKLTECSVRCMFYSAQYLCRLSSRPQTEMCPRRLIFLSCFIRKGCCYDVGFCTGCNLQGAVFARAANFNAVRINRRAPGLIDKKINNNKSKSYASLNSWRNSR